MKNKKENKNSNVLDERQMQIQAKSTLIALIFALVCLVIATIHRVITTDNIGWELWVIIGICIIMAYAGRFMGDVEAPKDVIGKPLPLGDNKEDKKARIRSYLLESAVFAFGFTALDVVFVTIGTTEMAEMDVAEFLFPGLDRIETIALAALIGFVITFIVFGVLHYIIVEKFRVKRYNALMAKLDAEDEDDE